MPGEVSIVLLTGKGYGRMCSEQLLKSCAFLKEQIAVSALLKWQQYAARIVGLGISFASRVPTLFMKQEIIFM